jgi:Ca2+-dependent lipid-binding protein
MIAGVRHYDKQRQGNKVLLDFRVMMVTDTAVTVTAEKKGFPLRATVDDIALACQVRVVLSNLVPVLPCFKTMSVGFTRYPEVSVRCVPVPCRAVPCQLICGQIIDFALRVGGVPIMSIPGLASLTQSFMKQFVCPMLVYPKCITMPIISEDSEALSRLMKVPAKGVLRVEVLRADKVRNVDFFGKSDPYCNIIVCTEPVVKKRVRGLWRSFARTMRVPATLLRSDQDH